MSDPPSHMKQKSGLGGNTLKCPKCDNICGNVLSDFGTKDLCGLCRNVWNVLDKWLKR